jgi:hypothetical protein
MARKQTLNDDLSFIEGNFSANQLTDDSITQLGITAYKNRDALLTSSRNQKIEQPCRFVWLFPDIPHDYYFHQCDSLITEYHPSVSALCPSQHMNNLPNQLWFRHRRHLLSRHHPSQKCTVQRHCIHPLHLHKATRHLLLQ